VSGRAARELLAPVQDRLGAWQAEAVKLETMAQRMRASGRRDAGLAEATRTLLGVVERQTEALEGAVAKVPADVREHSRVADTLKVLRLLLVRTQKILSDLGESTDTPR
jgi:hypothetical protein